MHREDDTIFFDETDKLRYDCLPDWAPIEAVPGIFEDILAAQQDNVRKIQQLNSHDTMDRNYAEYLAERQELHVCSVRLQTVAHQLGELAGSELIESMIPSTA